jgi:hypothetical protein
MGSWREVAAVAQRQRVDPVPPQVESFGLPGDIAASLRALEYMPAPKKITARRTGVLLSPTL